MTNAPPDTKSPYMKVSEVADHLNISARHVYDLAKEGVLEASRFSTGRLGLRIHRASVEKFEAESRESPAS